MTTTLRPGAIVRYLCPRRGVNRIGTVERIITRGKQRGFLVIRSAGIDEQRSTVNPDNVTPR